MMLGRSTNIDFTNIFATHNEFCKYFLSFRLIQKMKLIADAIYAIVSTVQSLVKLIKLINYIIWHFSQILSKCEIRWILSFAQQFRSEVIS